MRALVTGAGGFLGRHVARAATERGYHVTGLGHAPADGHELALWGIKEWIEGDVSTAALIALANQPDVIFHCAGGSSVAASIIDPAGDFRRTVDSTLAVLEYIKNDAPLARVVLPSSAGVYGRTAAVPLLITAALQPVSPYGIHKKIAEDICRSFSHFFGVRSAIVRLFSVYGPGLRKQLLWDACGRITGGDFTFSGSGEETRDWVHVEDAAKLMLLAADHASFNCPIVNGGTGEAVSIRDIVETVAACLSTAAMPTFNGQKRVGDPDHYQADITEALAMGWLPTWTWTAGVADYVAWYQEDVA